MHPPVRILPHIERFAREILAGSRKPALIRVDELPLSMMPEGSVRETLPSRLARLVSRHGGQIRAGWAIWERPTVYLEAELTAIWVQPDGMHRFLPAPGPRLEHILFLPDDRHRLDEHYVDNRRRAISDDKQVHQYLTLCEQRIKLLRKAGLQRRDQLIGKTPQMRRIETDIRRLLETINNRYGSW